jgi:predicted amidohydrolase
MPGSGMGICKEAWFPDCTAGTENSIISAYFTVRMMGADLLF